MINMNCPSWNAPSRQQVDRLLEKLDKSVLRIWGLCHFISLFNYLLNILLLGQRKGDVTYISQKQPGSNFPLLLLQHITGAHKDWVCSLDFLPSRNVLLSGCRGGLLKLWQIDRCIPICKYFGFDWRFSTDVILEFS